MTKTCRKCGQEKPVSEFSPNSDGKNTYPRSACKVCEALNKRNARKANGEHVRSVSRDYFAKNGKARTERAVRSKAWWDRKRAEGTASDFYRKYNYGLTPEQTKKLRELDPVCAICQRATKLDIDHCHTTNVVRGRLCVRCNTALGKFGDTTVLLHKAIVYLEARSQGALQ